MTDTLPISFLIIVSLVSVVYALYIRSKNGELRYKIDLLRKNSDFVERFDSDLKELKILLSSHFEANTALQRNNFDVVQKTISHSMDSLAKNLSATGDTLDKKIETMLNVNSKKLGEIKEVVDEKLQSTLESRLTASFKIVSERLERVYKEIGEMQSISSSLSDLKHVLHNVNAKGIWGEMQLDSIIKQFLATSQYRTNELINPATAERVEYVILLPNKNQEELLLPVDSKFPFSVYHALLNARKDGNSDAMAKCLKDLQTEIKKLAKMISEKYILPPKTTDFAILFLPIEALYSEVLQIPGIMEELQQKHRVIITGPTTFGAILNSLQLGFRTFAIESRSTEVWDLLFTIKTEFMKFASKLGKTRVKLDQASKAIGTVEHSSKIIERRLENVQQVDGQNANNSFHHGIEAGLDEEISEEHSEEIEDNMEEKVEDKVEEKV